MLKYTRAINQLLQFITISRANTLLKASGDVKMQCFLGAD